MENAERKANRIYAGFPDNLIEKARGQVRNSTLMRWDAGDLSLILQAELNPLEYSPTVIRMAVGKLYDVTYHTIRMWERVCRIVTDELRSEYDYSFEYWRAMLGAPIPGIDDDAFRAKSAEDRDTLKRERVCELATQLREYSEAYGMPPVSAVWG